jgi:small-conductance mechanosensitive channel
MILLFQGATWADWFYSLCRDVKEAVFQSIDGLVTSVFGRLPYLLAGLIVILIFWLLSKAVRSVFLAGTRKTKLDHRLRILISRMLVVIVLTVGIFTSLTVIIPSFDLGSVIAGLGFTSFVVGFATKDILNNFLSGILILWQQPFEIGDHIFVGSNSGKVEFIGVRATSLRKDDGELVLIPNGDMYSSALTIRSAGAKRRMTLKYNLAFDADIDRARELSFESLRQTDGVVEDPKPNVYVSDLTSDGVNMSANFWINTNESKPLRVFDRAAVNVLRALDKNKIELFPPGSMIVHTPDSNAVPREEPKKDEL